MRHKYAVRGIVVARLPVAEESVSVLILTDELGLIRARAQSVRKAGAKLSHALQTFAESEVIVMRGKDGWRLSGALLIDNWFQKMPPGARPLAGRVAGLLLRLVPGESADERLLPILVGFFSALSTLPETEWEAAEALAALRILHTLGLDAGEMPEGDGYGNDTLAAVGERLSVIARINKGIEASGL